MRGVLIQRPPDQLVGMHAADKRALGVANTLIAAARGWGESAHGTGTRAQHERATVVAVSKDHVPHTGLVGAGMVASEAG